MGSRYQIIVKCYMYLVNSLESCIFRFNLIKNVQNDNWCKFFDEFEIGSRRIEK